LQLVIDSFGIYYFLGVAEPSAVFLGKGTYIIVFGSNKCNEMSMFAKKDSRGQIPELAIALLPHVPGDFL
jgi:hypothetical protein